MTPTPDPVWAWDPQLRTLAGPWCLFQPNKKFYFELEFSSLGLEIRKLTLEWSREKLFKWLKTEKGIKEMTFK